MQTSACSDLTDIEEATEETVADLDPSSLYVPALGDLFVLGEATIRLPYLQQPHSKGRLRSYSPGEALRVGRLQVQTRSMSRARKNTSSLVPLRHCDAAGR